MNPTAVPSPPLPEGVLAPSPALASSGLQLPAEWWVAPASLLLLTAVATALALAIRSAVRDRFSALAAEALRHNNEGFLALASERFRALQETSSSDLAGRHKAIEDLVQPLHEALAIYQREAREFAGERTRESSGLKSQLEALASQTGRLENVLRSPGARGRWGELTLRRTAELAGLTEHCDFAQQVTLAGGTGGRPDMLVRLPAGREIAVDAKAPLQAYLDAADASGSEERECALALHAKHVRRHVDALSSRSYHEKLERSPAFVVLFLPDDGFLSSAVRNDRELVEYAMSRGVVVATPSTLYALLAAVAEGWREEKLAQSTRRILELARELDERLGTFGEHLSKLGGALGRAVESYNGAVGSFESRLLPQARRMRELGVEGSKKLEIEPVTQAPRESGETGEPSSAQPPGAELGSGA